MNNGNLQDLTMASSYHKKGVKTVMDDDDDGENINDEDGELGKTLSFIKCKPSLVKSNNSIQQNDRSASMTHQGFSTNNIKPNTSKNMSTLNSRNK